MDYNEQDFLLLKFNLIRFIDACIQAQKQKTTKGLKLSHISGTFQGFKLHPSFGSGNLTQRPVLAFLKDGNHVNKGIFPIIIFIPDKNEIITCKGISYDNKSDMQWKQIVEKDIPFTETIYNNERGQLSFLRNVYKLDELTKDKTILEIQNDINEIIKDYPRNNNA